MRKIALLTGSALILSAGIAAAGQPENPGEFGTDRAAFNQGVKGVAAPGASETGAELSTRAGENGTINQAEKDRVGGSPNSANDQGGGND